jgi:hypothetical protein
VIDDNDEQPEKHFLPKDATDSGIMIDDNDEHPEKQ